MENADPQAPRDATWTPLHAAELYGLPYWGSGYFGVSDQGTVEVYPGKNPDQKIDLLELVQGLEARDIYPPVVVRFSGILEDRMTELRRAFDAAIAEGEYRGGYSCVYPIKVNQQRHICEEIRDFGQKLGFGLEVGSKPELLAGLALTEGRNSMPLICNGFKDEEFIETVILAAKMGRNIIPVAEQPHELELIARSARTHKVTPRFGIRAKLASGGVGRWADSGGFRGKFGLSVSQILASVEYLKGEGLLDGLQMLHCHIGSQIFDIRTVKFAVSELAHIYVELVKLGAPMGMLDLGGGLGVDYDGSKSATDSSVNYTPEQYATDIVYRVKSVCDDAGVPHPDLVTESGRALVAHSGALIFQVLGSRVFPEKPDQALVERAITEGPEDETPQPLLDLVDAYQRLDEDADPVEIYHDAEHALTEAVSLFNLGYMSITPRAAAEELYWAIGARVVQKMGGELPDELADLPDRMGDIYFSNFSLFQSLIDSWGIDQIFPILPIHRLDEEPTRRGTLADITCDSDGRVDRFPGDGEPERTLALHELRRGESNGGPAGEMEPYYLAVFLTGAYQETLGDLHNLFGDTHAVHVALGEDGHWYLDEVVEGDTVREVLQYVQFDPDGMRRTLRREIEAALASKRLTLQEAVSMRRFLDQGIDGYTYLE
ncbi:MAG: biosynthetic arginine decarboxylase [Gemmatimonadota bacterium]|nr:biosynthetic arginine decarboxylase [Gemmatimonadota bacterium]MDH5759655.1 biosynthetic arginine decarboxylase [Gemmatimonadota bacterium]